MPDHLPNSATYGSFESFSPEVFRKLFEQTSQPATIVENGTIIEANRASVELFGMSSREELIGLSPIDVSPPTQSNGESSEVLAAENIQRTLETGHHELDWECVRKSGERFFIHLILTAVNIEERMILYAVYNDISLRKKAEMQLLESESRFRHLFESARQATILVEDGFFTLANQASAELLGLESTEELIGLTPLDISPVTQPCGRPSAEMIDELARNTVETGSSETEWECVREDGRHIFIRLMLTLIQIEGRPVLHSVFNDITEEKKARDRVEYLAYYNAHTGLPNRLKGYEELSALLLRAEEQQSSAAVLLIGLNTFRLVRNLHGRRVSDQLQVKAGERLRGCLRSGDSLYHLNSDEFMLTLDRAGRSQIEYLCTRILNAFDEPFLIEEIQIYSPVFIGISVYPENGTDHETLVAHADIALTEIREKHHNGYLLYEQYMGDAQERYIRERSQLREALVREEFTLHYQPKIDLSTGELSGAEALVRWNHPERGLVMPVQFIDIAEESGLIVPMSRWILREACTQAQAWRKSGAGDIPVAVNLSAKHFYQNLVEQDVKDALEESGLPPELLELELTESILLENENFITSLLDRWSSLGIQISVDDFGTGYSSLSYLSRFSLNRLKIDRSFILNLQHEPKGESIVRAILELGKALGLKVISEGVETQELVDKLKAMGCDEAQGYFYSKPLPAESFELWVGQRSRDSDRE